MCSSNKIKVYRTVLNNTYSNRRIYYKDLQSCIKYTWKHVKFVDIIIQNDEFNLHICCDEGVECNAKRYFDVLEKHNRNLNEENTSEMYSEYDVSFVKVARELNQWHIGTFILEKINVLSNGYDCEICTNIEPDKSAIIPLGVPLSRIEEFYGVRGLNS